MLHITRQKGNDTTSVRMANETKCYKDVGQQESSYLASREAKW